MIQWKKRSKADQTLTSDRKTWESRCGLYKVVFSQIRYGRGLGKKSIPDQYYAMARKTKDEIFEIISRNHRKKNPAIEMCEKLAKKLDKEAQKQKKKEA
tara:strand:- start:2318 stop:2614 length:297 start_codon:yes stop_codon:yes gene_type:complete